MSNLALDVVTGKGSFTTIYILMSGSKRFKEVERMAEGINTRMLVKELKALEAAVVLKRQVYATVARPLSIP